LATQGYRTHCRGLIVAAPSCWIAPLACSPMLGSSTWALGQDWQPIIAEIPLEEPRATIAVA
jgi:hypothetical protein